MVNYLLIAAGLVVIAATFPGDLEASGVGPTGRVPWGDVLDITRWDRTVFARPGDHITILIRRCHRHVDVVGVAYGGGPYQVMHSAVAGRDWIRVVVIVRGQGMVSFAGWDDPDEMPERRNVWIEIGERRPPP